MGESEKEYVPPHGFLSFYETWDQTSLRSSLPY